MNYHRDKDYDKFDRTFRNIFRKRVGLLTKYIKKSGSVIDIGCSNGIFLDLFKEATWETWGIEPSGSSDVAKSKKHKILNTTFEKANLPPKYFDLVILNHTLEHMYNPTAILKKVKLVLRPKGILYVDVPNAGGLSAKILGKHWPLLLPNEHKWQFTKASLMKLLEEAGFKVLHWQSRSGIFEFANPFKELYRKRFLFDILTSPYSLITSALNIGDSMSFICIKK